MTLLLSVTRRQLSWKHFLKAIADTTRLSCMVMVIVAGATVFVIKGAAPDVPLTTIFRGIWPFMVAAVVCIALIILFPGIALYLPSKM